MEKIKKLKIEIETKSPFRIGAKKTPFSTIEQPIVKIGGKIVIPGTTLKGALRHEIEKYLIQNHPDDPKMKPCIPASQLSEDETKLVAEGKYRGTSCQYPNPKQATSICPVCYLLGAQGLRGFITVPFLNLQTELTPDKFTSIRIDRSTGVAAKGAIRSAEILPEGVKFTGELQILIEDKIRGWKLGKPRPLQGNTLGDQWLINSDWDENRIIKELIKERLVAISALGSLKSAGAGKVTIGAKEI